MNQLLQGMESDEVIDCLLAQTKIADGPKVDAIRYHLVGGAAQNRACMAYSVKQSKLSEAITTLNGVAENNERYHELKVHRPDSQEVLDARIRNVLDHYFAERSDCSDCSCLKLGCDECLEPVITALRRIVC